MQMSQPLQILLYFSVLVICIIVYPVILLMPDILTEIAESIKKYVRKSKEKR